MTLSPEKLAAIRLGVLRNAPVVCEELHALLDVAEAARRLLVAEDAVSAARRQDDIADALLAVRRARLRLSALLGLGLEPAR